MFKQTNVTAMFATFYDYDSDIRVVNLHFFRSGSGSVSTTYSRSTCILRMASWDWIQHGRFFTLLYIFFRSIHEILSLFTDCVERRWPPRPRHDVTWLTLTTRDVYQPVVDQTNTEIRTHFELWHTGVVYWSNPPWSPRSPVPDDQWSADVVTPYRTSQTNR